MRSLAPLLALCLLASCQNKKEDSKIPPPVGESLPNLPTAIHSRSLESAESNFIELVISQDQSELFHQGKQIASTTSEEDLISGIKRIRKATMKPGITIPILLSAPASTPFKTIRERIRTAAEAGIHQILLLVQSEQISSSAVVSIELPTMGEAPPKIESYFLQINAEGHVFSGTGPGRTRLDSGDQDHQLNKLSDQLELFSAAAKSAGYPQPPCQIYVDPEATYQRVIDLISLTNKYHIRPFFTDMLPEPELRPVGNPQRKPTPPAPGSVQPLGLAPKK